MTTERQPEQAIPSDDAAKLEEVEVQPTPRRVAYKSVLAAVVVGIITISGLWLFVIGQEGSPSNAVPVPESNIQTQEATEAIGTDVVRTEDKYDQIDRRLASLSGRIDRGFETQKSHGTDVKRSLTAMAENVRTVKIAVADLTESNKELSRRISEAISRLDTLIKDVRTRKVVQRKPTAKPKPRPAKTPPFRIDAIDVWDDATYVAVSQAGRVAFLKDGEQQSGWTVTHIDRLKGRVDFQGPAGQGHSISLQR
jgi:archaellum component FlaC